MRINCQCAAAKKAAKINRHNFACNNLEYSKLKASTLILHVLNWGLGQQADLTSSRRDFKPKGLKAKS